MIYNNYRNDYYCKMYVVLDVFLNKFILHSHIAYCHFSIVRHSNRLLFINYFNLTINIS